MPALRRLGEILRCVRPLLGGGGGLWGGGGGGGGGGFWVFFCFFFVGGLVGVFFFLGFFVILDAVPRSCALVHCHARFCEVTQDWNQPQIPSRDILSPRIERQK